MKIIKKTIKIIVYKFFYIIDSLVHKKDDYWIIGNAGYNNAWNGNHYSFYEFLLHNKKKDIYILDKKLGNGSFIEINKISSLLTVMKAKVFIIHHGTDDLGYSFLNLKKRIVVLLWHGINLKGLSLTDFHYYHNKKIQSQIQANSSVLNLLISTSKIVKLSMISSFGILPEKVINTGYPRNDLLLCDFDGLLKEEQNQLERIRNIKNERKLITYVPTFRDTKEDLYKFQDSEITELSRILKENNSLFCLKGHYNSNFTIESNNNIINFDDLRIHEVQLLLRETDVLISDYSGILADYLLLDKPIIGFCYDLDKYKTERGFVYELPKIFPGKITNNFSEMIEELERVLKDANFETKNTKYEFAKDLFHQYQDDKSSERVYEVIQKLIKKEEIPKEYL